MPSPFPGMDPYLEPHWRDVHLTLIAAGRAALNRALPSGLLARSDERVVVEEAGEGTFVPFRPDVRVFGHGGGEAETDGGTLVIDAPYQLRATGDPPLERFLRVTDADGQLLTVIEILSPSNKREPGLTEFRRKRSELLSAGVHFVEVDLIRRGNWRGLMDPSRCPRRRSPCTEPWSAPPARVGRPSCSRLACAPRCPTSRYRSAPGWQPRCCRYKRC